MSYGEILRLYEKYNETKDIKYIEKSMILKKYENDIVRKYRCKGSYYKILKSLSNCSHTYIKGYCNKCNKEYLKTLFCGLEYCENEYCQQITQVRRKARLKDRFLQLGSIGYWVLTIPDYLRKDFTVEKIKALQDKIKYQLKKRFKDLLCIGRWHWFSEEHPDKFNPHLNLLTNTSFLDLKLINELKYEYNKILFKVFKRKVSVCVLYYSYFDKAADKLHKLNYVFRNTFLKLEGNEEYAIMLFKFRNAISYGKFRKLSVEERYELEEEYRNLPETFVDSEPIDIRCDFPKQNEKLELGQCIFCDGEVEWTNEIMYYFNPREYYKLSVYYCIKNCTLDDMYFLEEP